VGTGRIARCHLDAYRQYPQMFKLNAICEIRADVLKQFAGSVDVQDLYTDYSEMLAKADIDAVDICTSHDQHENQVITAAQAGKHILVEKAMGRSLAEARHMLEETEKHQVVFMVGQDLRYLPHTLAIKRLIEAGELGAIRVTRCCSILNQARGFAAGDWLLDGRKAGGGVLLSVTSHQIDLLRYFVGEVKSVSGICRSTHPEYVNGAEEYACADLEFVNGAIGDAIAVYSPIRSPLASQYMLLGDKGSIYSTPPEPQRQIDQFGPAMLASNRQEGGNIAQFGNFSPIAPVFDGLTSSDPFVNEIVHFADCCRQNTLPLTSGRDNLNTLKVVFGIYESSRSGRRIEMNSL
jgi:UDP-N-acetyl-2-amino-2-deoxyglucuronate dehydrogenase